MLKEGRDNEEFSCDADNERACGYVYRIVTNIFAENTGANIFVYEYIRRCS